MVTKLQVIKKLKKVMDPELNISIYDMGLIYDVKIGKKGDVVVVMTLTSIGCPLFTTMEELVKHEVKKVKGIKKVTVDLTFEPPWSIDMMTKDAREQLGFM